MKELFSIGEVSKLLGVSIKALRYYDEIGLLKPAYINEKTGYRYYGYPQFQVINRIRFLQNVGLHLNDIKSILQDNNVELLLNKLDEQEKIAERERQEAQKKLETAQWYSNYFSTGLQHEPLHIPYMHSYSTRYLLVSEFVSGNEMETWTELNRLQHTPPLDRLDYYLWYVYLLDFHTFSNNRDPQYLGIMLRSAPDFASPHIKKIPPGNYICFKCHYRQRNWDASLFLDFFKDRREPDYILAFEYELSLEEFSNSLFDIQALY